MKEIIMTPVSVEDVDFILQLIGNKKVTRYMNGMIADKEGLMQWLSKLSKNDHEMIVRLADSGERIGECSLTVSDDGMTGEIGYMLHPEYWDQGYGTETVRKLIESAAELGLTGLTALTSPKNAASVRVLEKHGFVKMSIGWMIDADQMTLENARVDYFVLNDLRNDKQTETEK